MEEWVRWVITEVEMTSVPAPCNRENQICGIRFHPQYYAGGMETNGGIGLCSYIVKEHVGFLRDDLCRMGLLRCKLLESWKRSWVNCSEIIQLRTRD